MDSNNIPNPENMNLFDSDFDEAFNKLLELPTLESLEIEDVKNERPIFDNANKFLLHWDENWINGYHDHHEEVNNGLVVYDNNYMIMDEENNKFKSERKKRRVELELEEIQKHFHMPINKAAKEMKVGLTVLKKRCRELNIMRWPHRKIKSLKSLINNVKEMGLNHEIEMLEEHKRLVEKKPDSELTRRTKKLRQACFKANYKKKRCLLSN